jgi:hypothetical protein
LSDGLDSFIVVDGANIAFGFADRIGIGRHLIRIC